MTLAERDHKIDVLRGLAVLGVLLIHTQNAWYLGVGSDIPLETRLRLRDHWLGILSIPVTFGFLGLNLFFVLSGLCIHLWTLKRSAASPDWKFSFLPYMKRRLTRLYPAYAGAIVFSLGCLALAEWIRLQVLGYPSLSAYANNVLEQTLRYLTFTHTLKRETFGGYNAPLYTMAIEFHFYLLYPLVLWGFRRFGSSVMLGASVVHSAAWTLVVLVVDEEKFSRLVMDSVLVRWPEWIAGCLLAEQWVGRRQNLLGSLRPRAVWSLSGLCLGLAAYVQIRYGLQLNVLWSAGLLFPMALYLAPADREETRAEQALRQVGLFSYSVYLLHYPVLRIFAILLPPEPSRLLLHLGIYGLVITGILIIGFLFFKVFEEPVLTRRAP